MFKLFRPRRETGTVSDRVGTVCENKGRQRSGPHAHRARERTGHAPLDCLGAGPRLKKGTKR